MLATSSAAIAARVVQSRHRSPEAKPSYRALARRHLDADLQPLKRNVRTVPRGGWIKQTREALGMSASELAARLDVSPKQIYQYEAAEQAGTIRLPTLERVAQAFGASVLYAIVTERPMQQMVEQRARLAAAHELAAVNHSMALEGQRPSSAHDHEWIIERARALERERGLWSRPI